MSCPSGEIELLRLRAVARSNQPVADEVVIKLNTARRHVSNIFDKTGSTRPAPPTAPRPRRTPRATTRLGRRYNAPTMHAPVVQYVKTSDGFDIAYGVSGDGPPIMVLSFPFEHVQLAWQHPDLGDWLRALAARFQGRSA